MSEGLIPVAVRNQKKISFIQLFFGVIQNELKILFFVVHMIMKKIYGDQRIFPDNKHVIF